MDDSDTLTEEERNAAVQSAMLDLGIEPMNTNEMEYLDDGVTYEELDFDIGDDENDEEYTPYTKKATVRSATTRLGKRMVSKPKRKTLKKEIELPIKIDLINLVKAERSLYNLKDPLYMSRNHKEKKWSEISDNMKQKYPEMTIEKCKRMWEAVRESTR